MTGESDPDLGAAHSDSQTPKAPGNANAAGRDRTPGEHASIPAQPPAHPQRPAPGAAARAVAQVTDRLLRLERHENCSPEEHLHMAELLVARMRLCHDAGEPYQYQAISLAVQAIRIAAELEDRP